jgi:hypothetical protein
MPDFRPDVTIWTSRDGPGEPESGLQRLRKDSGTVETEIGIP